MESHPNMAQEQQRLKFMLDNRPRYAPQLIQLASNAHVLSDGPSRAYLFSHGTRIGMAQLIYGWPHGANGPRITHIRTVVVPHVSKSSDKHIHEFEAWLGRQHPFASLVSDISPSLAKFEQQAQR